MHLFAYLLQPLRPICSLSRSISSIAIATYTVDFVGLYHQQVRVISLTAVLILRFQLSWLNRSKTVYLSVCVCVLTRVAQIITPIHTV